MNWFRGTICVAVVHAALLTGCASKPPVVNTDVVISFPPEDTVTSVEQADHTLKVAQLARQQITWRYQQKEQICYDRFFMNSCLLDAKNERRTDLARVKKVEVAANYFKRRQQVEDMDRNLYERNAANPLPDPADGADKRDQDDQDGKDGETSKDTTVSKDAMNGKETSVPAP